jgi:hypothetical protein
MKKLLLVLIFLIVTPLGIAAYIFLLPKTMLEIRSSRAMTVNDIHIKDIQGNEVYANKSPIELKPDTREYVNFYRSDDVMVYSFTATTEQVGTEEKVLKCEIQAKIKSCSGEIYIHDGGISCTPCAHD